MAELTMERLVDAEVVDDGADMTVAETVASVETLTSGEVTTEPEAIWSQRAIGCGAILCAGCPLVMMCPSARPAKVEAVEPIASSDIFEANDWQIGFGEIETSHDLNSSGQASHQASDGAPALVEARAADLPSPSESSPAEADVKQYVEKMVIEKPTVKKYTPINPSQQDSASEVVELQPVRTYLDELLDDSVEFVVAQSLRQPVIAEQEPVATVEITSPTAPATGIKVLVAVEPDRTAEVAPMIESVPTTEVISLAVEPKTDEPDLKTEEPVTEPILMDNLVVIEEAAVVDNVIDSEIPNIIESTVDLALDFEDVVPEIEEPTSNEVAIVLPPEPLAEVKVENNDEETTVLVEEIIGYVEDLLANEQNTSESVDVAISDTPLEEFHFDWRVHADDLDEEHWPFDENSDSLPIANKFKKIIVKFLGRQAFYALSSSGSSAD